MIDQLKHRLRQITDNAQNYFPSLNEEERNLRYEICTSCDKFTPFTTQCSVCRCIMHTKTYIPYATCPLNKWGKIKKAELQEDQK
jgi:hypothetical protein